MNLKASTVAAVAAVLSFGPAVAETVTWNLSGGGDWATPENWSPARVPTAADDAVIPAPESGSLVVTAGVAIAVHDLTVGGTGSGTATFLSSTAAQHEIGGDLHVASGGTLTHAVPAFSTKAITTDRRLELNVAGDATIDEGGSVDVSKCGFQAPRNDSKYRGPGYPSCHAGLLSGSSTASCYGSIREPTTFGAPGESWGGGSYGVGGDGGGAVKLIVAGTLTVNGSILSSGGKEAYCCTAGAGGSVWISAADLLGAGSVVVRPGYDKDSRNTPMAGGGRLALYLTNAVDVSSFAGTIGAVDGTFYSQFSGDAAGRGTLTLAGTRIREFSATVTDSLEPFKKIEITGGAGTLRCKGVVYPLMTDIETGTGKLLADAASVLDIRSSAGDPRRISGNVQAKTLVCTNAGGAVEFAAGSTVTVDASGSLTLRGGAEDLLALTCPTFLGKWTLSLGDGVFTDVAYAAVSNGVAAVDVTDTDGLDLGGNNEHWRFVRSTSEGCKIVWTGAVDDSWDTAGNWVDEQSQVRAVTPTDAAVIPSGCALYPKLAQAVGVYSLTVCAGAALELRGYDLTIAHGFANTGTVTCVAAERISVGGDLLFGGASVFVPASSTLTFAGTAAQKADTAGGAFNAIGVETPGVTFLNGFAAQSFICAWTDDVALAFSPAGTFESAVWHVVAASGHGLSLNSTLPMTAWHLKTRPGAFFSGVTVNDSDASSGATVYSSDYTGVGNENWRRDGTFWTGAEDSAWTNAANWAGGVPDETKAVIILVAERVPTNTSATTVGSLTVGDGSRTASVRINGALTVVNDLVVTKASTLIADQPIVVSNDVTVADGGVITHTGAVATGGYYYNPPLGKVNVTVLGDMTVEAGGKVDVTKCGYAQNSGVVRPGPGGGKPQCAYGGRGSDCVKPCYGSIRKPTDWGSSSGDGWRIGNGAGGGAVFLSVAGALKVDGDILATGVPGTSGGGTGGSVWLTAGTLTGRGKISCAPGGNPYYSTGGGRMAIYQTIATDLTAFTGTFNSTNGTRYVENADDVPERGVLYADGSLICDLKTNQVAGASGVSDGDKPFSRIVCTGTGKLFLMGGIVLPVYGDVDATNATVEAEAETKGGLDIRGAAAGTTRVAGTFDLGAFVCTNGTAALEFAAEKTVNVRDDGVFCVDGGKSAGGRMALRSSAPGTQWRISVGTNLTGRVQNLDVADSDASGGETIKAKFSVGGARSANNLNWKFSRGLALIVR